MTFAYSLPYTYSMLTQFIAKLKEAQEKSPHPILKVEQAGSSLSGVTIPMLTISNFEHQSQKQVVLINARVHPGETHASWALQGLIIFLLSKNPAAQKLRSQVTFKIIPMLNIDGVICGNYRVGFSGLDINRMYGPNAVARLNPESNLVKSIAKGEVPSLYFDLHGHSSKKSVFIYGPRYPLHSQHYVGIRVLPKLLQARTPMFRYYSCRFANQPEKQNCARLVLSRELQLANCYTMEASMWAYFEAESRKTIEFDPQSLLGFGKQFALSIYDWVQVHQ